MKIRTQLIGATVIFAVLLVFVSGFVITTNQQVDLLTREEDSANGIAIQIGELGYLSNEYILYREPQQADQWNAKFASIFADIAGLSVDRPEQRVIVNNLAANLRNIKSVFDDISSTPLRQSNPDLGSIEISLSRTAVQNQGMIFDASRLAGLIREEEMGVRMMRLYFTFALMGSFAAFLLAGYFLIYRRTLKSIDILQEGAGIVGAGNLDHQIEVMGNNEIDNLSRSFNRMTTDLKGITARKTDLEVEAAERKRIEGALRESEERYRTIVETANEGIWVVDAEQITTFVNATMSRMLGYSPEEMIGKSALSFMDEEDRAPVEERLEGRRNGQKGRYEHKYIRKDGSAVWTIASVTPLMDPGNRFAGSVGMLTDITDRKRAEEALLNKNVELNALNEELTLREEEISKALTEKEVLLSEIHHRVKNNLAAFISLLSLEGSTEESTTGRELKKDLQNRARSMALIHETLYRTQQFSIVEMDVYLTPLVNQVIASYRTSQPIRTVIEAKGVALDLVRATPAGLIVNELVTNSLKHAFPGDAIACRANRGDPCTIGVRLIREDGWYQLSVFDNGIGLVTGFDPLTARSLGLKLVNFLAKHQMRAEVEVHSDNGTEFIFRFRE